MSTISTTVLADNVYGTLASSLSVTDTALAFTTGHGARFPVVASPNVMYCVLLNAGNVLEEIQITAHADGVDSATIIRGVGGTTAKAWSAGDRIEARISSAALDGITSVLQAGTGAVARTAQAKARDWVAVEDFGTVGVGGDDATVFQKAIDTGKNVRCSTSGCSISSITLSTSHQKFFYDAQQLTITGNGIVISGTEAAWESDAYIISNTANVLSGGAISPAPSVSCAFNMRASRPRVKFGQVSGFVDGILFEDGNDSPDGQVEGTIQLCTRGVGIKNTTGVAKHEGNRFNTRIFACDTGALIHVNCQYQHFIGGVIDCAGVTGSKDINNAAGRALYAFGFVRPETDSIFGAGDILLLTNGGNAMVKLYNGAASEGIIIDGKTSRILMREGTAVPFMDFLAAADTVFGCRIQAQSSATILDFTTGGALTAQKQVAFRVRDPNGLVSTNVGIAVVWNDAGTYRLANVTVGALDSGGTNFRLLRVPNS